jgi:transposase-like protein
MSVMHDFDTSPDERRRKAVVRAYKEGKSIEWLMEEHRVSRRQIRRLLFESGIESRAGRPSKILDSQMPRVYRLISTKQVSYDELAIRLGVSSRTLRRKVRAYERQRSSITGRGYDGS